MRGVQKCTRGCSSLRSTKSTPLCCINLDTATAPPYNTGSAFEHYDDNLEHSQWLNLMKPRLELLRRLLKDDGSIWISIDDDEQAYLEVLCDEVFGRKSFVASVVWQKRTSPDNDPRGSWTSTDCTAQAGHGTPAQFYTLTTPAGRVIELPDSLCWRFTKERMIEEMEAGRIWLGKDGMGVPRKKTYLAGSTGVVPWTWWSNKEAKKENNVLFGSSNAFATPKPERLIERIISIASNKGDLILDSFLGSGTTAAVAHKMGRRYIGIEMGDHAYTHCKVRLDKVIAGKDQGGITKTTDWQGGSGGIARGIPIPAG